MTAPDHMVPTIHKPLAFRAYPHMVHQREIKPRLDEACYEARSFAGGRAEGQTAAVHRLDVAADRQAGKPAQGHRQQLDPGLTGEQDEHHHGDQPWRDFPQAIHPR